VNDELGEGKRGKAIPVTGCGGPRGCEMSRLPHFLDNQLSNGSEVVSLEALAALYPQEDSWYSFLLEGDDGHNHCLIYSITSIYPRRVTKLRSTLTTTRYEAKYY
jgi:hypothetical protein